MIKVVRSLSAIVTLLYNTLDAVGELPANNTGNELTEFTDIDQVAPWAKNSIMALVKSGIITGSNGKLIPVDTANRAQMAQVMYNLLSTKFRRPLADKSYS